MQRDESVRFGGLIPRRSGQILTGKHRPIVQFRKWPCRRRHVVIDVVLDVVVQLLVNHYRLLTLFILTNLERMITFRSIFTGFLTSFNLIFLFS